VPAVVFAFGDFRLDCGRFELLRNGQNIRLERKPMELLILLAESNGRLVTRTEIAGRLWDKEVFVDTEHGINTAVRKIRNALRDDPENPQFVQTVPGRGYCFIAAARANASEEPRLELAAQPAEPQNALPAPAEETEGRHQSRWVLAGAAGVAAALVLGITVGPHPLEAHLFHRGPAQAINSLAVIPLDNFSGDRGQDAFADRMTDELVTMLAKDTTLRVTSRTSMMRFKGTRRPLPEIAGELGVDGILEGSVSHTADRVHMTVQLINARTDAHVWAESYDRALNDASSLPDEAARAIAARVHQALPAAPVARYVNPEAHEAYLRGRYLWENFLYEEAGKSFRHAIELQPDLAGAWAGLSAYYGGSAVDGFSDPRDAWPKAEGAAVKAIQLDPALAEGHNALAAVYFFYHWDWERTREELRRAEDLDPRLGDNYQLEAKLLAILNRKTEAVQVQKKAMELNPFVRPWGLVMTYDTTRQYDAALEDARLRLETYPKNPVLLFNLSDIYRCKGMHREAAEYLAESSAAFGHTKAATEIRAAFKRGGYPAVVRWQIAEHEERGKTGYSSPVEVAQLYALLGNRERALTLLEEGLAQRSPQLVFIQSDPAYDFLHGEARYRTVVRRVGLPESY